MQDVVSFTPAGIAVIGALLSALVTALVVVFRLLIAAKDAQLNAMESERDGYRRALSELVDRMEEKIDLYRASRGEGPTPVVTPVRPLHNSPVTEEQQGVADYGTLVARAIAAAKVLDLSPMPDEDFSGQTLKHAKDVLSGSGIEVPPKPMKAPPSVKSFDDRDPPATIDGGTPAPPA